MNNWIHTGETETGLEIWVKQEILDSVKYLKYQYRDSYGKIFCSHEISFNQVRLLNSLVDTIESENGK